MSCNRYDESDEAYELARMTGDWPEEDRINAIGQNGGDGAHYDKVGGIFPLTTEEPYQYTTESGWDRLSKSDDSSTNKYKKQIKGVDIDVYDVLVGFDVKNPAVQHAIKKMLCAGQRGYKTEEQDINEAIQSLERAKEL